MSHDRILGMYLGAMIALGIDNIDAAPELTRLTKDDGEALDVILAWRRIDGDRVAHALAHLRNLRTLDQAR